MRMPVHLIATWLCNLQACNNNNNNLWGDRFWCDKPSFLKPPPGLQHITPN